jgi:hypothetical protein
MSQEEERTVRAPVEVQDEKLSPRANEILTEEVREALGADEVEVSESHKDDLGRSDLSAKSRTMTSMLWESRVLVGVSFFSALVVGAIIALITGKWWAILIPEVVHLVTTLIVSWLAIRSTTNVDKPSAVHVEQLEEEGVRDPEETLNNAIQEFAGDGEDRGKQVMRADDAHGVREDAPGGSPLDQQSAVSPSSESEEVESGGLPGLMPLILYGSLLLVAIIIPIVTGVTELWLVPAIAGPVIVVAYLVQVKFFPTDQQTDD